MGEESPLHHELNRNCNINGRHEDAGGWKNRLVGGKMTINGSNSHPEENLFISFPCFCMHLVIWDDCIQYEVVQRRLRLKFCGYWQKLLLIGATLSIWQLYIFPPRDSPLLTTLLLCHNSLTSRRHLRKIRSLRNQYVLLWWGAVYTQHISCQSSH